MLTDLLETQREAAEAAAAVPRAAPDTDENVNNDDAAMYDADSGRVIATDFPGSTAPFLAFFMDQKQAGRPALVHDKIRLSHVDHVALSRAERAELAVPATEQPRAHLTSKVDPSQMKTSQFRRVQC